ncbi:hypothetical protein Adt_29124 [Abeliophyllum distichum]|uniref:Transmembrane protein n=1 Tax=Abeliophyllum distichum TaxID=126358 RepID=A0ABD1RZ62_9LAMI
MLPIKIKPFSLIFLSTIIFIFPSVSSSIDGVSATLINHLQTTHIPGVANEIKYEVGSWGTRRSVLEGGNGGNSSLILAADRTRRKDPLDDLKYYIGGWNISNEHYRASVLYTGSTLFLVAAFWFVGFGVFLLLVCLYVCCCRRRPYGYSRFLYALSLVLLSLFTFSAVIGSVILYTGQEKFQDSTKDTLDYVVQQAESTVNNLTDVSHYLAAAKKVGVNQVFLPKDVQNNIDKVDNMIASAASTLETQTENNKNDIFHVLDSVRLILIVVATITLVLALLGFLLSIAGFQFLVYILVVIGWILVAVTFIICGVFLVLHNVTGDTCVAMDQWIKNPTAHTALDDIIPCVDADTAQESLSQSKEVTIQMVGLVNGAISNVSNANLPPGAGPISYNQSGPLVPILCNPYHSDKTDRKCVAGEVDLRNATQVWKNYECQVSKSNICTSVGRLTPSMYDQLSNAVNVSYGLNHYSQFLTNLIDCTFVRDTFSAIHDDHCPDLRLYSKWVYIGLVMVSVAVMLSLILWVLYARERRHRKYTKLVDEVSFESRGS